MTKKWKGHSDKALQKRFGRTFIHIGVQPWDRHAWRVVPGNNLLRNAANSKRSAIVKYVAGSVGLTPTKKLDRSGDISNVPLNRL